jgi:hypothetical protein
MNKSSKAAEAVKKLRLNRETLWLLKTSDLKEAVGGASIAGTCNTCAIYGTAACCHLT